MTTHRYRPAASGPRNQSPIARRQRGAVAATITDVISDRTGLARLDTGGTVRTHLPDALWLRAGDRVMLYPYPDGWVAVLRIVIGERLDWRD